MEEHLHIVITGEDQGFLNALKSAQDGVRAASREIEKSGMSIEQMFGRIKQAAALSLAGFSAKEFAQKVITIRGEFQKLEVAFNTMLGSAEKANALMQQLTKTAAITPFDLQGVTNGAKQLLAYGIEAEKVNDTLVHLGDIAAGLSLPLTDLVYLYGTTMVQGRMFTRDLLQFQNRGIPIAEELAKVLGVTKDKVGELITAGKVGAKEFNAAIMAMSSEGGKFGGLMEAQSKTITGQISNIEDAIDVMFNNIGKSSEGIINDTLSVISSLVENYEKVGRVIVSLVGVYGTYKTAVMLYCAVQKTHTTWLALERTAHLMNVRATEAEIVAKGGATAATVLLDKAQKMLNATMLANPYVFVATAIAGLVAVMWNMKSEQERINELQDEYNRKKDEAIAKEEEHKRKIDELCQIAGDEKLSTDTRREAMLKLKKEYPDLFKKYNTEIEALKNIAYLKGKISEIEASRSSANVNNELADVNRQIAEIEARARVRTITMQKPNKYGKWESKTEKVTILPQKDKDKLQQLKNTRNDLITQQKQDAVSTYMKDLTGISNEDLQAQINERRNLLAKMTMQEQQGKKNHSAKGRISFGGAAGTYSRKEIEDQLKTFEWEQNRRKQVISDGSKDFVVEARKAYEKEKAELEKLRALTDPAKRAKSKMVVELAGKDVKVSEMSPDQFSDAIAKQKQKADDAAKKLEKLTGQSVKSSNKKAEEEAERDATRRQKMFDAQQREEEAQAEQRLQTRRTQTAANIAQIKNDALRQRAEEDNQYEQDKEALNERIKEYKQKNLELAKARFDAENTDKKKVWADTKEAKGGWQKQNLTKEQQAEVDAERAKIEAEYQRIVNNRYKSELQSMRDFLKEYGTLEEQKLAITQEYEEKIAAEQDPAKRASLALKRDNELLTLQQQQNAQKIDWSGIFTDLSGHTKKYLESLREQLQGLINGGGLSLEDMARAQEKIRDINALISEQSGVFSMVGPLQIEYNRRLQEEADAKERLKTAIKEQLTAEASVNITKTGLSNLLQSAGMGDVEIKKGMANPFKEGSKEAAQFNTLLQQLYESEGKLADARKKTFKATQDAKQAEDSTHTTAKGNWEKFLDSNGVKNTMANLSSAPGLLGSLGLGEASEKAQKGLDGMNDAMGAVTDYMSGNYIGALSKGISAVSNFGEALGIWSNSNREEVEAANKALKVAIDVNTEAVNRLTEAMEKATPEKAYDFYTQAKAALESNEQAARQTMENNAYMYDGGHSLNYDLGDANGSIRRIFNILGLKPNGDYDIGGLIRTLSGEEMNRLYETEEGRKALQDLGKAISEAEDDGNYNGLFSDILDYMNSYSKDRYEELARQFEKSVTNVSFDSMYDGFVTSLMDMNKDAEDFADDFEGYLRNAIYQAMAAEQVKPMLEKWYDAFAAAMRSEEANGKYLSPEEINDLMHNGNKSGKYRDENGNIIQFEGLDAIKEVGLNLRTSVEEFGLFNGENKYSDSEASGSINAAKSMSEDTANELVGHITATHIAVESFKIQEQASNAVLSTQITRCITTLDAIASGRTDYSGVLNDILFQHVLGNQYLEDIAKANKKIEGWEGHIKAIRNKIDTL